MILSQVDSAFLRYLLSARDEPGGRLPSLDEISAEVGISVGKLREQLEVARFLGLVEVGPRRGIRKKGYDFVPAVRLSLMIALSLDRNAFVAYSTLRIHLETSFWDEAVVLLTDEDKAHLRALVRPRLAQAERAARPDPAWRTSRAAPDHLPPPGEPVCARIARGVLGRL